MRLVAKCVATCFILAAVGLVLTGSTAVQAKDKKKAEPTVKVGDSAPKFESMDENGKTFKSADVVGKKVIVLYFYPADFTPGCTKQACGFRDDSKALTKAGALVLGVSGDSVANHKLFKDDFKLPFTLLADEKGDIAKTFGIPYGAGGTAKGKKDNGDTIDVTQGVRIQRWTVVIGLDGKVAAKDPVKDYAGDSKRIEALVKKLDKN